jgi:uncharacterized membrane protein YdbT with pleckstrin-like domain
MTGPALRAPGGIIYEPGERVLASSRPFPSWVVLLLLEFLLLAIALYAAFNGQPFLARATIVVDAVVVLFMLIRVLQYLSRVWVLTDRRVIARSGIFNRTQAAVLLERVQDVSLTRPFPASMVWDYGILHLETAGIHSEERVTEGLHEIAITGASRFYAQLTDALTPGR